MNWVKNIAFMGLGALAFWGYEKMPGKISFGREYRGQRARRHLGGISEALAWEQAGAPPGVSMAGHSNRGRRSRSRR